MLRKLFAKLTARQEKTPEEWSGLETGVRMGHGYAEFARNEAEWKTIWENLGRTPPCPLPADKAALAFYSDFETQTAGGLKAADAATETMPNGRVVHRVHYGPAGKLDAPCEGMLWGVKLLSKPCDAVVANNFLANPAAPGTAPVRKRTSPGPQA